MLLPAWLPLQHQYHHHHRHHHHHYDKLFIFMQRKFSRFVLNDKSAENVRIDPDLERISSATVLVFKVIRPYTPKIVNSVDRDA